MKSSSVYIGIDVACKVGKRLPICIVSAGRPLVPLSIPKQLEKLIPRGVGNMEITANIPFQKSALSVASTLKSIAEEIKWKVERIAVDAPAAPPTVGARRSETALERKELSSFRTPEIAAWPEIREKCIKHLKSGGTASTLPYANKIWMIFGFELFSKLRSELETEVIEVYPYAIVRALLPACEHKKTEKGYRDQLSAVAVRTGWAPEILEANLQIAVGGSRDDRLDAFMAAWVASLPIKNRCAFGDARQPDDAIWVPN